MASPTFLGFGHTPTQTDTTWFIEQRILGALNDLVIGPIGGGHDNIWGSGSPVGVRTPDYKGQYYTNLDVPGGIWVSTGLTAADWREYLGNL